MIAYIADIIIIAQSYNELSVLGSLVHEKVEYILSGLRLLIHIYGYETAVLPSRVYVVDRHRYKLTPDACVIHLFHKDTDNKGLFFTQYHHTIICHLKPPSKITLFDPDISKCHQITGK